jgi:hypothetical protein
MKVYKLWLEIEEFDVTSGQYRNLAEEGIVEPVPVAVFSSLEQARVHAEAFAMDGSRLEQRWLSLFNSIN